MLDCCRLGAALALLLCLSAPLAAQTANGQGTYQPQLTPQQQAARLRAQQEAMAQANQAAAPPISMQMPPGFPLPADHAQYVESLLDHWQKVSQQVQMYKCSFRRFEYDTTYVQYRDPQTQMLAAHLVGFGEVRYAAPDRARFETHKLMRFKNPPQTPGGNAEYEVVDGYTTGTQTIHERWVCDGKSILDFDFEQKRMYETTIPPQLQGNIVESPLPFLFGANKQDILRRLLNRLWYQSGVEGLASRIERVPADQPLTDALAEYYRDNWKFRRDGILLAYRAIPHLDADDRRQRTDRICNIIRAMTKCSTRC